MILSYQHKSAPSGRRSVQCPKVHSEEYWIKDVERSGRCTTDCKTISGLIDAE